LVPLLFQCSKDHGWVTGSGTAIIKDLQ